MLYSEIRQFLGTFIDIEEKNESFDYNLNESSSPEDHTNELHKFNQIYNSFFMFNNRLVYMFNNYEIILKSDDLKQIVKLYNFYKSKNDNNSLLLAEFLLSYYNSINSNEYKKNVSKYKDARNNFIEIVIKPHKKIIDTITQDAYKLYNLIIDYGVKQDNFFLGEILERSCINLKKYDELKKNIIKKFLDNKLCISKVVKYDNNINENISYYEEYINRIKTGIKEDLFEEFPELELKEEMSLWDILAKIFQKTNRKFMFIMDEWDAVFHMPFISQKERQEYLLFLKNLLKDQVYVELAYMTGILPIAKYSAASELNMFVEYNMATRERFSSYFGCSEEEVDKLFQIYSETSIRPRITRHDLKIWYDGYCTASGEQLYNPHSIICALSDNQLGSYWTGSGPYDEIFYYIKGNIDEVREDFILMISGEHIEAKVQEYAATAEELTTKNQIYSAMVIYGLLTYEDGEVFIPNRELMYKYNELLLTNESLGYVYRLAKESERMLKATLAGDTQTMAEILEYAHNTESPILSYNNEIELSAIVNLVYLAARDKYRVEREDK